MGFRSNFITTDTTISWPEWFKNKWNPIVHFPLDNHHGSISSKQEIKLYVSRLVTDIQKVLLEINYDGRLVLLWLHECDGVTRVAIEKNNIILTEPTKWNIVSHIGHDDWCLLSCNSSETSNIQNEMDISDDKKHKIYAISDKIKEYQVEILTYKNAVDHYAMDRIKALHRSIKSLKDIIRDL